MLGTNSPSYVFAAKMLPLAGSCLKYPNKLRVIPRQGHHELLENLINGETNSKSYLKEINRFVTWSSIVVTKLSYNYLLF